MLIEALNKKPLSPKDKPLHLSKVGAIMKMVFKNGLPLAKNAVAA